LCYHGLNKRIRLQEQKLLEIFPDQEDRKTFFGLLWPRLLDILGFSISINNLHNGYILMKNLLFMVMKLIEKLNFIKKRKKKKNERDNDPPDAIYPMW
jgi:hypothetical protein